MHLIPGVDDGAEDEMMALMLLLRARDQGIRGVFATPHSSAFDDDWEGTQEMISLDEIRRELSISPSDNQTPVVKEARERAKALLRKKQSFVWNATNLTQMVRGEQINLFESYGASVRIVHLETDWEINRERNRNREAAVPEERLKKMLSILEPPSPWEARKVEWETDEEFGYPRP